MKRRWLGVLLSLLIPGFGLLRAGLTRRAVEWFLGLMTASLIVGICVGLSAVPFPMAALVFSTTIIAQIWMLCDSFRAGRMTFPLWILFAALFVTLMLLPTPASLIVRAYRIPAGSMEPTLLGPRSASSPDHVFVDRLSYRFSPPRRGDLIVFATSGISDIRRPPTANKAEILYIKRLVGLPGERIRITNGKLHADDRQLGEPDGIPSSITYTEPTGTLISAKREGDAFVVGPNEYFVLGDNSPNSHDSRYWGCVPSSAVYGKVTMIYYPFNRAGRVGPQK